MTVVIKPCAEIIVVPVPKRSKQEALRRQIKIDIDQDEENSCVNVTTMVKTNAKTGVEMEALTAASIAGLTIYDMCKAVDRNMNFKVWLASKSGGRSGNFVFDSPPRESST